MKEDLLKIINHYGVRGQLRQFNEESYELEEAIINAENNKLIGISRKPSELAIEHIAEEIADVCVMLREFMEYYNITQDEITEIMEYKINRQLERIKGESNTNENI